MSGIKITRFRTAGAAAAGGSTTGTPTGGDLGGTLPAPTVEGIKGYPIAGTLDTGDVLVFDGTQWTLVAPSGTPSGAAGGDLAGTYPNPSVAKLNGIPVTGSAAAGRYIRATGAAAAGWDTIHQPDYPFHDEPLTDGASDFIFAGGDVVVVIGVPNQ